MIYMHQSTPPLGNARENDALFAAVYGRLKAMASRQLARGDGGTLNTTALVHELYMKVCANRQLAFDDPVQFFAYAAQAMRHIMVDRARARLSDKRGGGAIQVDLDQVDLAEQTAEQVLDLDEALRGLERSDPRAAELVALHYFGGLPLAQIADLLGVTVRTLSRDWRFARAVLYDLLG